MTINQWFRRSFWQRAMLPLQTISPPSILEETALVEQSVLVVPPSPVPPTADNPLPEDFWHVDTRTLLSGASDYTYHVQMDFFFEARRFVVMSGKAGPIHPHSFRIQLRCQGKNVHTADQVVVPFHEVRQAATSVVQAYNHQLLNDLLPFRTLQPTTENLVAVLCQQLERSLAHLPVELRGITLWESPTKAISYDKSRL